MLPLNRAYNKRVIQDPHKNIPYMHYTALLLEKSIYVIIVYFLLQAHIKNLSVFPNFIAVVFYAWKRQKVALCNLICKFNSNNKGQI